MEKKNKKENSEEKQIPVNERLQMAVASILDGRLFIEEAVEKYEVLPSNIIQELRRIQKLKNASSAQKKKSK